MDKVRLTRPSARSMMQMNVIGRSVIGAALLGIVVVLTGSFSGRQERSPSTDASKEAIRVSCRLVRATELAKWLGYESLPRYESLGRTRVYAVGHVMNSSGKTAYVKFRLTTKDKKVPGSTTVQTGTVTPNNLDAELFISRWKVPGVDPSVVLERVAVDVEVVSVRFK